MLLQKQPGLQSHKVNEMSSLQTSEETISSPFQSANTVEKSPMRVVLQEAGAANADSETRMQAAKTPGDFACVSVVTANEDVRARRSPWKSFT